MLYAKKTFTYEYPVEEADVVLIGIPWDFSQTGHPTRYGPLFIREAIKNVVGYDPKSKSNVFEKLRFCDLGDVEVVPGNWKLTSERVIDTVKSVFEVNPNVFPVFLGGDHLITLGVLNGLKQAVKNTITVLDFDAHRDLMPDFLGEKFSHVTWANHILKDKRFELVQVGCRSWSEGEEKLKSGVKNAVKTKNPVYITVDLDVFDPKVAPEVGTPEHNGISFADFVKEIRKLSGQKIIGMDIVECSSHKINTQTANLAANIFKSVLISRKG
jgi:agmatinase